MIYLPLSEHARISALFDPRFYIPLKLEDEDMTVQSAGQERANLERSLSAVSHELEHLRGRGITKGVQYQRLRREHDELQGYLEQFDKNNSDIHDPVKVPQSYEESYFPGIGIVQDPVSQIENLIPNRNTEVHDKNFTYLPGKQKQIQNVLRTLPAKADDRKLHPVMTGVVDYFPLAIAAVARISKAGNDQHNPGQPLHWARGKSTDHADCVLRHLIERGTIDTDGMRHSAKMAWRALALLQEELEAEAGWTPEL